MKEPTEKPKRGRPLGLSRSDLQCVSYLPFDELKRQLRKLQEQGGVGHWWAVEHEPDEDSKKVHQHVRMCPPLGRTCNWSLVVEVVQATVVGEDLPRRLVVSKQGVNDKYLDGLLYARHDSRYLSAKGLVKAHVDYPREAFATDDDEWFDGVWAESDQYEPTARKLTKAEILVMVDDARGEIPTRDLLRLCLLNDLTQGDFNLFCQYSRLVRMDRKDDEND